MKPIYWLSLFYILVSVGLFQVYGVKYVNDSHRYLEYADHLKSGFHIEKHNFWYLGYVLFIYLITAIHDSYGAIVLAQYTYGLVAVWCLFFSAIRLFANARVAVVATLLFIGFVEITAWHSYLLAESFLTSSICVSIYFLSRIQRGDKRKRILVACMVAVLFTAFAKPTGFALLAAVSVVVAFRLSSKITFKTLRWATVGSSLFLLGIVANTMLSTFNVVGHYQTGEIVYASSKQPERLTYESMFISVPTDLDIPTKESGAAVQIMSFTLRNPLFASQLFFKKMFYFLFHVRPYWSLPHNIFSLIFLCPLYFLAVRRAFRVKLKSEVSIFAFAYLLLHVLAISATSVDWDGRFLMPLIPVLVLIASIELAEMSKYLRQTG